MKPPTEFEIRQLLRHFTTPNGYDPVKAHQYYEEHKHLKGRQKGAGEQPKGFATANQKRHEGARAQQRKELAERIKALEDRLRKLEDLIKKREHEEKSEDRKSKAKKERAAKERNKPKTAAEKAEAARESEKYRKEHRQELKTKAKRDRGKSGGGSSEKKTSETKKHSVSELKSLATKVKGQIAVAKQKLAAL